MTTTEMGAPAPVPAASPRDRSAARPWWQLALPGVVLGTITAGYRLGYRGLWLDEAFTLGAVHQLRSAVPETGWTMAGYYAFLRMWFLVSESVWWMRLPSLLAAVGAVAVSVAIARRITGEREAVLAGVVIALSPLWLVHAQEARSYGFVMLAVAVTWLAVVHGTTTADPVRRRRWWLLHTGAAVVLPLLHGLTVLQLLPQLGVLLVARSDRTTWLRAARGIGASLLLTLLLARGASGKVGDWVGPVSRDQMQFTVQRFLSRYPWVCTALAVLVLVGAAVAIGAALRARTPHDRARALVPVLWGLAPLVLIVLVSLVRPSLMPRYVVGCVPGVGLLMAAAVERTFRTRVDARAVRLVVALAVVAVLGEGHLFHHSRPLDGWTVAARRVAAGLQPGDTILLPREEAARPPFESAWRDVDPAAEPVLVPSDRPLGEVLRFEPDATDLDVRWEEARSAGRIWILADANRRDFNLLPKLTQTDAQGRPPTHRQVGRWRALESPIYVILLEPVT